jgi:hypothetical protein
MTATQIQREQYLATSRRLPSGGAAQTRRTLVTGAAFVAKFGTV